MQFFTPFDVLLAYIASALSELFPARTPSNHIDRFCKDTCIDFGHREQENLGTSRHANEHIFGEILGWD
jgi:hypothetical protein